MLSGQFYAYSIPSVTFFLPQWIQNGVYVIVGLLFLAVLAYILLNKKLSNGEKFLLLVICFVVPLAGCLIAVFYTRTFEPIDFFSGKQTKKT